MWPGQRRWFGMELRRRRWTTGRPRARSRCRPRSTEHVANKPIAHHVLDALEAAGVREVVVASSDRLGGRPCASACRPAGGGSAQPASSSSNQRGAAGVLARRLSLVAPLVRRRPLHRPRRRRPAGRAARDAGAVPGRRSARRRAHGPPVGHAPPAPERGDAEPAQPRRTGPRPRLAGHRRRLGVRSGSDPQRMQAPISPAWRVRQRRARTSRPLTSSISRSWPSASASAGGTLHVRARRRLARLPRAKPVDLLDLNRIVLDQHHQRSAPGADDRRGQPHRGTGPHPRGASVRSSVSVLVGPGSDRRRAPGSRDAYIGPYTCDRRRCARVEGAEIERSIISARSRASATSAARGDLPASSAATPGCSATSRCPGLCGCASATAPRSRPLLTPRGAQSWRPRRFSPRSHR